MAKNTEFYTLTNFRTGELVSILTADNLALWSNARLLLGIAKDALKNPEGQEYLQVTAIIASAEPGAG